MKSILSLFLIAFFIQNILTKGDFDITIYGIVPADHEIYGKLIGCFNTAEQPMYSFYLDAATTGFTEKEYEWKLLLDDKFTYASCLIYGNYDTQQIPCAVNILLYPLKTISFPAEYRPYNENESFTVTGWENIASKPILDKPCYPSYLYSFAPSPKIQHEVVCDSAGNNQVTIYGEFKKEKTPSQSVRRLSSDAIEFDPILIVDGALSKAKCSIKETEENSSEDTMVCTIFGERYFEFFPTTAVDKVENVNVLVEDSKQLGLVVCDPSPSPSPSPSSSSSFLKIGGILLVSLLLL